MVTTIIKIRSLPSNPGIVAVLLERAGEFSVGTARPDPDDRQPRGEFADAAWDANPRRRPNYKAAAAAYRRLLAKHGQA